MLLLSGAVHVFKMLILPFDLISSGQIGYNPFVDMPGSDVTKYRPGGGNKDDFA